MYIQSFMILIDKIDLEERIEKYYCQSCRRSKNFNPMNCVGCKVHLIVGLINNVKAFDEFVPEERYDKLVRLFASHMDGYCPRKLCPDIDFSDYDFGCNDDSWECSDCWREVLREKFF